jgi:hypothetical protein
MYSILYVDDEPFFDFTHRPDSHLSHCLIMFNRRFCNVIPLNPGILSHLVRYVSVGMAGEESPMSM